MSKFLTTDEFRTLARRGSALGDAAVLSEGPGFSKTSRFTDDGVGPWAVLTSRQVDHSYDRIDPQGWDLSAVRSNFPVLVNHRSDLLPVGQWQDVQIQPERVVARPKLAKGYDLAETARVLIEQNTLRGVSVGFRPTEFRLSTDPKRPGGIDFIRQVMIEASLTATPCNPEALILAQAKGIDLRPLRRLQRALSREERMARAAEQALVAQLLSVGLSIADAEHYVRKHRPRGNCARPASRLCGLKDSSQCAIHRGR